MEISLTRRLRDVSVLDIELTVGRAQRRPDLLSVLMRAHERDGRIEAKDVCEHLLQNRPLPVGRAILRRCHSLGLLDPEGVPPARRDSVLQSGGEPGEPNSSADLDWVYHLTREGRTALETRTIFVPEAGRYRVWMSGDPLLESALLDLVPQEENRLYDEVGPPSRGVGASPPPNEPEAQVPEALKQLEGRVVDLAHTKPVKVLVMRVGQRALVPDAEPGRTTATWTLSPTAKPTLALTGMFTAPWMRGPQIGWEKVWQSLLGNRSCDWVETPATGLLTEFEDPTLKDDERLNMARAIKFASPVVPGLGAFEETEVRAIPTIPRTKQDAQAWALWSLERRVDRHLAPTDYDRLLREVASLFSAYPVSLPPQDKFATQIATRERAKAGTKEAPRLPPAFWFLQAPLDLPREVR